MAFSEVTKHRRTSAFVLDGVLYHESGPRPRRALHRHPRLHRDQLRRLRDGRYVLLPAHPQPAPQRIYCADPARDHGVLEPVLQRGRRAVNFRLIAEQWDRIGQFYAAFPAGHASASAARSRRLNRFQASNRFYAVNRELGRALRPNSCCSTCPNRNCGPRCGGGCSRSSSCTPWPAPSTTGSGPHQRSRRSGCPRPGIAAVSVAQVGAVRRSAARRRARVPRR